MARGTLFADIVKNKKKLLNILTYSEIFIKMARRTSFADIVKNRIKLLNILTYSEVFIKMVRRVSLADIVKNRIKGTTNTKTGVKRNTRNQY